MKRELPFIAGLAYELVLLAVALLWGQFFHCSAFAGFRWAWEDAGVGAVAVLPPLAFFLWTLKSKAAVFRRHQELLENLLRRVFANWPIIQLLTLSLCTGIAEEALFRGAIQGSLAERIGPGLALVLGSLAFGAVHIVTWTYAIIAAFIGAYLGLLWTWTGNLLTPIVTHAVYDFCALVYFLKWYRKQ